MKIQRVINHVYEVSELINLKLEGLINKVYGSINQVYEVSELINLVYEDTEGHKPCL